MLDTAIDLLATLRLVRLIMLDKGTPVVAVRTVVIQDWTTADWQAELLECPWCLSFWIGLGVACARRIAPRVWGPIAFALAGSLIAGMVYGDDD